MTCALNPQDPQDAWTDQSRQYPGGMEGVAQRLGMNGQTLRNKLLRSNTTHHFYFDEFSRGLHAFEEARLPQWSAPLHALAWEFGHVCIPVPSVESDCPQELTMGIVKIAQEIGDVARETADAAKDGVITKREFDRLDRLDREIEEAMAALAAHREALKALAGKGKR